MVPVNLSEVGGESEQANSAQALWTKSPSDISDEDYSEFYKTTFSAFDDPYITIHNKTEGSLDFTNLLFVPKSAPFDMFDPERKTKISLYINRVFISQDVEGIIPSWLRFVQGILDTSSLDLNVSREMVQNSPVIQKISKSLTKRVLTALKKKLKKDEEGFDVFWSQFGKVIKEGLYEDIANREKIAEIVRVYSSKHGKLITLQTYLDEMVDKQESIYFLTADTLKQASSSPHLEGFKAKGVDVLLLTDPIDAFWISQMNSYQDKAFVSISRDKYDLSEIGDVLESDEDTASSDEVVAILKAGLETLVEDVKTTTSLVESPVRLVAGKGGLDFNLERILKAQNPEFEGSSKVLEVNAAHPVIKKIPDLPEDVQKALSRVLFEQARIMDGEMPTDSKEFSEALMKVGMAL